MNFLEKTLENLAHEATYAFYAEEIARKNGLLQNLDPRVKVLGLLALMLAVALAHNLWVIFAIFLVAVLLAIFSSVSLSTLAVRAWSSAFIFTATISLPAIFITPGNTIYKLPLTGWAITYQGLYSAIYLIARVETITTLSLLLVLCTLWTDVLKALKVLGVPVIFIVILGTSYRYIFLLFQTALDILESRRSRMVGTLDASARRQLAVSNIGVLLSKSFYLSNDIFLAMQSRGFRGEVYTLDDFQMRPKDWLALIIFLVLSIIAFWFGR